MQTTITRTIKVEPTARVKQCSGIFDIPDAQDSTLTWEVNVPIEDFDWNVGLILGASGDGKTTVARELFGEHIIDGFEWDHDKSILDSFPEGLGIKELTGTLSSVGFSNMPAWMRPFRCLSNGEKFRATIARALVENSGIVVIDEFTSVVDRTVAKAASNSVAKAVRRNGQKFVGVSCHEDVVEWLDPDWVFYPRTNDFKRRRERRGRPKLDLRIARVHHRAWELFKLHHYLSHDVSTSAACYVAFLNEKPVAFCAVLMQARRNPNYRIHRIVTLPDYQGLGIGKALLEFVAGMYSCWRRTTIVTSHPGLAYSLAKSDRWYMFRKPSRASGHATSNKFGGFDKAMAIDRATSSFEYTGPRLHGEAEKFEVIPT